jgi:site-specific DNA-cytosine methylase
MRSRARFAAVRDAMLKSLEEWGYQTNYKVLNTKTQGLPQSRPRFYMVALYSTTKRFKFPKEIEPTPLSRLLERPDASPMKPLRATERTKGLVQRAYRKLRAKGLTPWACEAIVDVGASARWSAVMEGCSPCLTASRLKGSGGHYLLHFKRMMTEKEACRLQGIPDNRVDYINAKVRRSVFLHAVGNAMSSNVLARVLARAWLSRLRRCLLTRAQLASDRGALRADFRLETQLP